jgi:hypothetical protein
LLEAWGAHWRALLFAESVDSFCLSLMIIIIALNSLGQFLAVTITGWLQWQGKDKPSSDSPISS